MWDGLQDKDETTNDPECVDQEDKRGPVHLYAYIYGTDEVMLGKGQCINMGNKDQIMYAWP